MRRKIQEFLSDEQRASRILLNWIVGLGLSGGLIGIGAILLMK